MGCGATKDPGNTHQPVHERVGGDVLYYLESASALMQVHGKSLHANHSFVEKYDQLVNQLAEMRSAQRYSNVNSEVYEHSDLADNMGTPTTSGSKNKRMLHHRGNSRQTMDRNNVVKCTSNTLGTDDPSSPSRTTPRHSISDTDSNPSVSSSTISNVYRQALNRGIRESTTAGCSSGSVDDLLKAAAELCSSPLQNMDSCLVTIARKASWLLNAERCTVWLKEGKCLYSILDRTTMSTNFVVNPLLKRECLFVRREMGPSTPERYCIMTGSPLILDSTGCHNGPSSLRIPQLDDAGEVRNSMWVPVVHEGDVHAIIKVSNKVECMANGERAPSEFNDDDEALLGSLNLFVSTMVSNALLYQKLDSAYNHSEALLGLVRSLSTTELDFHKLCNNIINSAKQLLDADRCSLFVVDKRNSQLKARFENHDKEFCVPLNSGIAGHVATTGETCNIPDAYADKRFNKEADKQTGYRTNSILCVPIKHNDSVIAVAQLVNKKSGTFTAADEETFAGFSTFAAINIRNTMLHEQQLREKRTVTAILETVKELNEIDIMNTSEICRKIMERAKDLVKCDRCALFMVDKEFHQLYSTVANQAGVEIRFSMSQGIAGHVARTGKLENIPNAYADARFNTEVDKRTGYITNNILCVPVCYKDEVIAVAQLVNKADNLSFDKDDERTLLVFSEFAAMSLRNASLFQFMLKAEQESKALLNMQAGNSPSIPGISVEQVSDDVVAKARNTKPTQEELDTLFTPDFPIPKYNINDLTNHDRLVRLAVELFVEMGFVQDFHIEMDTLYRFVCAVKSKYRHVPYHNFTHAFDVAQTLCTWLLKIDVDKYLTVTERFVLLIAGLCHDLDHMGLNNSFLLKVETPLGVLSASSGSTSVLEVHHCNVAIEILQNPATNILSGCSGEQLKDIWKSLIESILSTDMARHNDVSQEAIKLLTDYKKEKLEHRRALVSFLLKAADISNITKPFEISRVWGQYVTAEFYWQGDQEREANLDVTPMFDRQNSAELAAGQVGFIQAVGLPLFSSLSQHVPELQYVLDELIKNREKWQRILDAQKMKNTKVVDEGRSSINHSIQAS
eukprot:Sspe_Gene.62512::Locus_35143_Transcript_1_1_Confidence_1.000_Length_3620::g.62512::m.62512/K13298/PDE11; dual 3',5'-cyclic-AMP and -GMP phosphodiesterase 11